MSKAARVSDAHVCNCVAPLPHVGGLVVTPCSPDVITNRLPQARGSDRLFCAVTAPNFIVTGARDVLVNGMVAARVTSKTLHPPSGEITHGSPDVWVGGPTGGATLGDPAAGKRACEAARAGRANNSKKQSYSNCGVETARQIINRATGKKLTEDQLLMDALALGRGAGDKDPSEAGGLTNAALRALLASHGVPSYEVPGNMNAMAQGVAEGKGVSVAIYAGTIWPNHKPHTGPHFVLVTGIKYGADGKPEAVIINDTGAGDCGMGYPAAQFESALMGDDHVVTSKPLW